MDNTFGFAIALSSLRAGHKVARRNWNGANQFLKLQVPDEHSKMRRPYIYISPVDGDLVPWVASQSDMLAEDWFVVEETESKMETYAPSTVPSYIIESDGDAWFCHDSNFVNLVESDDVVFAPTPQEALAQYIEKFNKKNEQ